MAKVNKDPARLFNVPLWLAAVIMILLVLVNVTVVYKLDSLVFNITDPYEPTLLNSVCEDYEILDKTNDGKYLAILLKSPDGLRSLALYRIHPAKSWYDLVTEKSVPVVADGVTLNEIDLGGGHEDFIVYSSDALEHRSGVGEVDGIEGLFPFADILAVVVIEMLILEFFIIVGVYLIVMRKRKVGIDHSADTKK